MKELSYSEALNKAAAFCSSAEKCRSEVEDRLRRWGVAGADVEKIIMRLEEERFIDERRYAEAYVKDKFRYNKWGRRKIALMLRAKGVDASLVDDALAIIDEEEYGQCLASLLESKLRTMKFKDSYDRDSRLLRFAAGHGFETSLISSLLKRL